MQEARHFVRRGNVADIYEGKRRVYKLKAHHETTFRDAWATDPPVLCHISRIAFDIEVERVDPITLETKSEG